MNRNFYARLLAIFSLLFIISCQRDRMYFSMNCIKCLDINYLWEIIGSDSSYYEFYFDNKQIFFFEEGIGGTRICLKDSSVYSNFLEAFCSSNSIQKQSEAVKRIFTYICDSGVDIKSIKPIGSFLYRISNDPSNNYILFSNEASDRYFKYKGYNVEDETPDSVFEVITIPEK